MSRTCQYCSIMDLKFLRSVCFCQVALMKESVERNIENEERKRGLIILEAWYGRLVQTSNK